MEVRIQFDQTDPPVGRLCTGACPNGRPGSIGAVPFTGWLGLLRALSDTLAHAEDGSPRTR